MAAAAHPGSLATRREDRGGGSSPVLAALAFGLAAVAAAGIGSVATTGTTDSAWYLALDKPPWYPPGAAFGIVWTPLYVMIAVSGWRAWRHGAPRSALALWGAQMALNLGWTLLFFGARLPGWALAEIIVLLAAIAATALAFRPHDRVAAWLLAPYAAWVAFATTLSAAIVVLN